MGAMLDRFIAGQHPMQHFALEIYDIEANGLPRQTYSVAIPAVDGVGELPRTLPTSLTWSTTCSSPIEHREHGLRLPRKSHGPSRLTRLLCACTQCIRRSNLPSAGRPPSGRCLRGVPPTGRHINLLPIRADGRTVTSRRDEVRSQAPCRSQVNTARRRLVRVKMVFKPRASKRPYSETPRLDQRSRPCSNIVPNQSVFSDSDAASTLSDDCLYRHGAGSRAGRACDLSAMPTQDG